MKTKKKSLKLNKWYINVILGIVFFFFIFS
jgi:hypothetical protein